MANLSWSSIPDTTPGPGIDPLDGLPEVARGAAMVFGLLAVTLMATNFLHKQHVPVPEAIAVVVIGVIGGALAHIFPEIQKKTILDFENMSAREFMIAFIAPIMFAEGYGLKSRQFFSNMTRILVNAFFGTVVSAVIVASCIYYIPKAIPGFPLDFTFAECFTFGVIVSATDPVTTLAIFKEQNMVEKGLSHLYYSVLGESILNDAVAITLFEGCNKLVLNNEPLNGAAVATLAGDFCVTWFGSVALGVSSGLLAALLLKFARLGGFSDVDHFHFNVPEMGVLIVLAYLPFLIAESTDILSPIVAVLFAGITMRHYAHYNLTITTRQVFLPTVEFIANMCETYAFLLLGLGVFLIAPQFNFVLIGCAILGCLVGRAAFVYPCAVLNNKFSKSQPLTRKEMHVVWFAGLRGAVAFVCTLRFPENEQSRHRNVFLCTTFVLVFLSMLGFGWPTAWMLKFMDIKAPEGGAAEFSRTQEVVENSSFCQALSGMLKTVFMAPDAREERESNVRLSRARRSSAVNLVDPVDGRLSATGVGLCGHERSTVLSQRLSTATGQRPSAARTICDP